MNDNVKEQLDQIKKENPLLKRKNKFPGETFRLPSKGLLYYNGELDDEVKDGEVTIYPMTTLDEIYMKTPDMLFQGTAIDVVFKRCIPQIKKPLDLFSNDVDFLLTALRKVSYGNHILINHVCEFCGETSKKEHEYSIPLNFFIQNTKEFSIEDVDNLKMILSTGEQVILKPLTFSEMLKTMQMNDTDIKSPEDIANILVETLSSTIRTVDGVVEKEFIEEWLSSLPTQIISEFSSKLEKLNKWGTNFEYTIRCKDCDKEQKINTILNPLYFFILPSNQKISIE